MTFSGRSSRTSSHVREEDTWIQQRKPRVCPPLCAPVPPCPLLAGAIAYGNIDPITLQPYIENGPAPLPRGVAPAPDGAGPSVATASSHAGAGHKGAAVVPGAQKAALFSSSAGARPVGVLLGARQAKPSPSPLKGMFSADMQRTRATAAAAAAAGASVPSEAAHRHSHSSAAAAAASAAATSFSLSSLATPSFASAEQPSSRPFSLAQTPGPPSLPVAASGSGDPKRFGLSPRLPFAPVQHFAASDRSGRDATPSERRPPEVDLTLEQSDGGEAPAARGRVVSAFFANRTPAARGAGSCGGRDNHQGPHRPQGDALARREGLAATSGDTGASGHAGDSCITTPASPEHPTAAAAETRARPAPTAVTAWDDVGEADAAMLDEVAPTSLTLRAKIDRATTRAGAAQHSSHPPLLLPLLRRQTMVQRGEGRSRRSCAFTWRSLPLLRASVALARTRPQRLVRTLRGPVRRGHTACTLQRSARKAPLSPAPVVR